MWFWINGVLLFSYLTWIDWRDLEVWGLADEFFCTYCLISLAQRLFMVNIVYGNEKKI
jgi:hypothetical protein